VEIREGDSLETLRDLSDPVDFLLNDVFPAFTLPVLQLVAPHMRPGAVALCGNAALFPADHWNGSRPRCRERVRAPYQ
jgi:predicted O-methyltransferase YrrM